MTTKFRLVPSLLVLAGMLITACSSTGATDQPPEQPTEAPTMTMPPEPTKATDGGDELSQAVDVSDQDIMGGRVVIDRVVSDGPGWVVIHITADGSPGPIIGYAMVEPGETTDLAVDIDAERATEQLFAMLHVDAGQGGVFEFPDGPDVPATQDNAIVNTPFTVVLPEVMVETLVETSISPQGEILVDFKGMSLYLFMNDKPDESTCYGSCAANWPPLIADGDFGGGEGVDTELIDTTTRDDGTLQVTYNGWPLYYYGADEAPGDTNGQGVGGVWFLVSPEGNALTATGGDELPDY
ncbi:MAG: hypothetical protein PVF85_01395 [Anaerolineales bacterium]